MKQSFRELYDLELIKLPHKEFVRRMKAYDEAIEKIEVLKDRLSNIDLFHRKVKEEEQKYFVHDQSTQRTCERLSQECEKNNKIAGARRHFINTDARTQRRRTKNKHAYDVYTFYTVSLDRVGLMDTIEKSELYQRQFDPVRELQVLEQIDKYMNFFLTDEGQRTGTFDRANGVWYHDMLIEDLHCCIRGLCEKVVRGSGPLRQLLKHSAPRDVELWGPEDGEIDKKDLKGLLKGYVSLNLGVNTRLKIR
jgi:hypothetical protein